MPEIAIKQTLNDASFRRGLAENGANIRNWGREAQKAFTDVMLPAERYSAEVARLEKVHREGYLAADAYQRSSRRCRPPFAQESGRPAEASSTCGPTARRRWVYERTRTPMEASARDGPADQAAP